MDTVTVLALSRYARDAPAWPHGTRCVTASLRQPPETLAAATSIAHTVDDGASRMAETSHLVHGTRCVTASLRQSTETLAAATSLAHTVDDGASSLAETSSDGQACILSQCWL